MGTKPCSKVAHTKPRNDLAAIDNPQSPTPRHTMRILVVAVTAMIFVCTSSPALSQDDNVDELRNLFRKMEGAVNLGSTDLIMCNPGLLLDPNLNPDDQSQALK